MFFVIIPYFPFVHLGSSCGELAKSTKLVKYLFLLCILPWIWTRVLFQLAEKHNILEGAFSRYVLVWEHVSKQKILLVLSQKQCFKFRNHFFFYKDTFIYHINLEKLKKNKTWLRFFCVFLKIWLWKEAKIYWKSVPICYTSKLTVLFGSVTYFFKDFKTEFYSKNVRTLCTLN